jgi:hypothetical protein
MPSLRCYPVDYKFPGFFGVSVALGNRAEPEKGEVTFHPHQGKGVARGTREGGTPAGQRNPTTKGPKEEKGEKLPYRVMENCTYMPSFMKVQADSVDETKSVPLEEATLFQKNRCKTFVKRDYSPLSEKPFPSDIYGLNETTDLLAPILGSIGSAGSRLERFLWGVPFADLESLQGKCTNKTNTPPFIGQHGIFFYMAERNNG